MRLRCILVGVLLFAMSGVASAQVPLPAYLSIQPPDAGVPAADAAFSSA